MPLAEALKGVDLPSVSSGGDGRIHMAVRELAQGNASDLRYIVVEP